MLKKDYTYSESEKVLNKVVKLQDIELKNMHSSTLENLTQIDNTIELAEEMLLSLDVGREIFEVKNGKKSDSFDKKVFNVRSWEDISEEAINQIEYDVSIKDIFTEEELNSTEAYLLKLREEFNAIYRLDAVDYTICGIAGLLSAAVDIFMVGMPESPLAGIKGGTLSNYIRKKIDESLSIDEIKKLEKKFWVPYDSANNSKLQIPVEGLSSYFHRFQSLGHDPILGFVFGVLDIMNGTFTAIDKNGNLIKQVVSNHETVGMQLFDAIERVFGHMKSDIATSRGLPVPFMTLLNLFQFGNIGEEGMKISEVARSMYGQGYDFIHFLSMSLPVMLNEVIVRSCYCAKRVKEGHSVVESIPFDLPFNKKPKLGTMLFITNSIATAANAGKVAFTENPLAINYAQWLAFAKYSFTQLRWVLIQKPHLREKYVMGFIDSDWFELNETIASTWNDFTKDAIVLFN